MTRKPISKELFLDWQVGLIANVRDLEQEHAELLEALKLAVRIIPRAWMSAAPVTYAEWDSAFEKIEAIIAKVEK